MSPLARPETNAPIFGLSPAGADGSAVRGALVRRPVLKINHEEAEREVHLPSAGALVFSMASLNFSFAASVPDGMMAGACMRDGARTGDGSALFQGRENCLWQGFSYMGITKLRESHGHI